MALIWKDVLEPGTWHLRDGRAFECRPEDMPHFAGNLKGMLDAGLNVPIAWEHHQHAVPLSTQELVTDTAKHCFAHLRGARLADGRVLEVALDDAEVDPEDLAQFKKTKFVSPYFQPKPYTDDTGREWPAWSIMHIAATPTPINRRQRPFNPDGAASVGMSAAPGGAQRFAGAKRVGIAYGPAIQAVGLSGAIREEDMADEAKPDDEVVVPDEPAVENADAPADDAGKIKEAVECMAKLGLHVGSATTADNFLDQLIAACKTKEAHESADVEDETGAPGTEGAAEETSTANVPVMMSTMQANLTKTQAELASVTKERDTLKATVGRAQSAQIATIESGLKRDITDLVNTGRITPNIGNDLKERLRTEPVALSAAGTPVESSVIASIKAYQKLPANASWPAVAMSGAGEESTSTAEDLFPVGEAKDTKNERESQAKLGEQMAQMVLPKRAPATAAAK